MLVGIAQESNKTQHRNMRLEGGERKKKEEGNHRFSPCETSDGKQDWREVASDAGLGFSRQTACHMLCEEADTELLFEININKEIEA